MMISLNDRKICGIAIGIDFTLAADEEGNVFVWGKKEPVQRIAGPSSKTTRTPSTFASTISADAEKPVKICGDKTIARKLKKKDVECPASPFRPSVLSPLSDYPPLSTHLRPLILRLTSLVPTRGYDFRRVLFLTLDLLSREEREDQQSREQPPQPKAFASLRPLVAHLYWMHGMRSLCLAALLKVKNLSEEEAAALIRRHFSACSLDAGDKANECQVGP